MRIEPNRKKLGNCEQAKVEDSGRQMKMKNRYEVGEIYHYRDDIFDFYYVIVNKDLRVKGWDYAYKVLQGEGTIFDIFCVDSQIYKNSIRVPKLKCALLGLE